MWNSCPKIGFDITFLTGEIPKTNPCDCKQFPVANSHLCAIQSQFKGQLSAKVIEYFSKFFGYALEQNRNNRQGLKKNLKAFVPHILGKHDQHCRISWCGFLKDPFSFCHSSLPHGKDLKEE